MDHINPTVALTQMFQTRNSGCEVSFVGADGGMEIRLVPKEGYPIETVIITNFRRSLSPALIGHNVRILLGMNKSKKQTNAILDRLRPGLVVGTGGHVFFPVVGAAAKRGIPTVIHESNAVLGLTTRILSKVTDVVTMGFEESRGHYDGPGKVVVTSTPVRTDFFRYTRKETRAELGLTDDRPLVFFVWGSLGAEVMNYQMAECIALECQNDTLFHHVHGAGWNYRVVLGTLQGSSLVDHPEVDVREYIYDMPLVMTAADLVLCRTGASTIAEIAAITKSAVLVSSPDVVADHQIESARVLANVSGVVLLSEGKSSGEKLYALMTGLLSNAPRRGVMSRTLRDMVVPDAAGRICQTLARSMEKRAS